MDLSADVAINKVAIIERSIKRFREEYALDPTMQNYTHIDAMILNIERACQACIDLALHLIAVKRLGNPQNSAEAFAVLHDKKLLAESTAKNMMQMVTFRNIAVHQYQSLDFSVLATIATERWRDMVDYCAELGYTVEVR